MIVLHQVPGAWGLPSVSPFCVKLQTWLRMAGLPYRIENANPARSPKGKIPYVEIDGTSMGDSQLILEHLTRVHAIRMDAHLSAAAHARGHATRRMLEEGSYWQLVHARWIDAEGFAAYRPAFLAFLPPVIGGLILWAIRRNIRSKLVAQGTGRHTPAEIDAMAVADADALAALLGEQPFLLGDEPTSVDASVYAFVSGILAFPVDSAVKRAVAGHANLVAYRARMEARFWATQGAAGGRLVGG